MKIANVCALSVGMTLSSFAAAWTIASDGFVGCRTKADFDSLITAVTQKDESSFRALLISGRCVSLKSGQTISVVDYSIFGATEILYQGTRLFTVNNAVKK